MGIEEKVIESDSKPKDDGKTEGTTEKAEESTNTSSLIDNARDAAARIKEENDRREALLAREEELQARKELGGTTEAGSQPPKEEPISDLEFAKKVERGEINPLKEDGLL